MIYTKAGPWKKARKQNATDGGGSYGARPALLGKYPSLLFDAGNPRPHTAGDGDDVAQATARCFLWANDSDDGDTYPNAIQWMPFGAGSDTNTFLVRWLAWNGTITKAASTSPPETWEWDWFKHSEWTCTLTTATGASGGSIVGSGNRFCDTIAIVTNAGDTDTYSVLSPQDDTPGMVTMDFLGVPMLEPQFQVVSATSGNLLYRFLY